MDEIVPLCTTARYYLECVHVLDGGALISVRNDVQTHAHTYTNIMYMYCINIYIYIIYIYASEKDKKWGSLLIRQELWNELM